MGEAGKDAFQVDFDRSAKLEFHGSTISSDGGLLACRKLDEAFALTAMADQVLTDPRTGSNIQHNLTALLRQSIYSRLAGDDDTNDADRLSIDPVMRQAWGAKPMRRNNSSRCQVDASGESRVRVFQNVVLRPWVILSRIGQERRLIKSFGQH